MRAFLFIIPIKITSIPYIRGVWGEKASKIGLVQNLDRSKNCPGPVTGDIKKPGALLSGPGTLSSVMKKNLPFFVHDKGTKTISYLQ